MSYNVLYMVLSLESCISLYNTGEYKYEAAFLSNMICKCYYCETNSSEMWSRSMEKLLSAAPLSQAGSFTSDLADVYARYILNVTPTGDLCLHQSFAHK